MMKLCSNLEKEDEPETVLEISIPEEMSKKKGSNAALRWHGMCNLMRSHSRSCAGDKWAAITDAALAASSSFDDDNHCIDQSMLLLRLVGSAFIPYRAQSDHAVTKPIKDGCIEACTAKYIVQQYLAATGGLAALNGVNNMCAVGKLTMVVASDGVPTFETSKTSCEPGGFVLWQKNPDLWYLQLVVSGYKINAGSDGNTGWSLSSSNLSPFRGPPRPLRRFFQGLDPRSTANLFLNTVCIGEKVIKNEHCFILKLDTSPDILKALSTTNTEIVHHTIWGYFSQRTGLLIQFEDTKLVRMKKAVGDDCVYYETSMESELHNYRLVDGINLAHSGKTKASLYRYGKKLKRKWKLEETWNIEEVEFNISGLSEECFLPPSDVNKEDEDSVHGVTG